MTATQGTMTRRMLGAAFFDVETYEEVEHDENATSQAAAVVLLVALCQAVGGMSGGAIGAIGAMVLAFVSWLVWAGITYLVGEKLFQGRATWGELLRTIGFAQAPGVLFLLDVIPGIGMIASVVASLWIMVAGFIAIRQALDIGNVKTFLTVLVGGGVYVVLSTLPFVPFI